MIIRYATRLQEIEYLLKDFDAEFSAGVEKRVVNLSDYAKKIFGNSENMLATIEENILGFVFFYCNDHISRKAFVSQICVQMKYRRMGVGAFLLENAVSYCKQKGMSSVHLECAKTNKNAIAFYEKHGFVFDRELSEYGSFLLKKEI